MKTNYKVCGVDGGLEMNDKEFQVIDTTWLQWYSVQRFAAWRGYVYTGKQFVNLDMVKWGIGAVSVNSMIRVHNEGGGYTVKHAKLQFSKKRGLICQNHMVKFRSEQGMGDYMRFIGTKPEKEG